jgi:mRNA-degrading endonuclease RelE of RelBE toxin-antitoxin system
MTARLSLYRKAEEEVYKLDRSVKAQFFDFCHLFRKDPHHSSLDTKKLKGESRIHRAKINQSYRALLAPVGVAADGIEEWLIVAVRHRKDVYEELQVAVNRVTGEIEFVDLSIVGDSALRRAGVTLTPAEPDPETVTSSVSAAEPTKNAPLLAEYTGDQLRDLGVAEQLIDVALAVTDGTELDQLVSGAPLLSADVLYGLASGMDIDEVRREITAQVRLAERPNVDDFTAAAGRTQVTTIDDDVRKVLDEGNFRAWKVYPHPTQKRLYTRTYRGPARVSGGPGTGKTIVALHRAAFLAMRLPEGDDKPILLTTFTKNLTTDLRLRLASMANVVERPENLARIDITHIDQLAARVLGENTSAGRKKRISDQVALTEMQQMLAESNEHTWQPAFVLEEWDQVILGQAVSSRSEYFRVRRAGRGRALTRLERSHIWKIVEQFTARLDKLGVETWGQASERAARYEMERATRISRHRQQTTGDMESRNNDSSSDARRLTHRYRHIIVDEAQDLRPAHWKMLRAMVEPGLADDLFIAADTHQRIYDHQVSLGALGINIRGRSARLTLNYRTTRQILSAALRVIDDENLAYDDLDDGVDRLAGYRSVLGGPTPAFAGYPVWADEVSALAETLAGWLRTMSVDDHGTPRDPSGRIAVCVADREGVAQTISALTAVNITCAELTKDGPRGDGMVHVGTMHRFKGLEYERLAIVGVSDGIVPRSDMIDRYRIDDPARFEREQRKARALLFVAMSRARDVLQVSWHGKPSPYLPA